METNFIQYVTTRCPETVSDPKTHLLEILLSARRYQYIYKGHLFGCITGPDEFIHCQQLSKWLADEFESSVDVPCLCF